MHIRTLALVFIVILFASAALFVLMAWICQHARDPHGRDVGSAADYAALGQVLPWPICGALPSRAKNITYSYDRSCGYGIFEFVLPEEDFLAWCQRQDWPVRRVVSKDDNAILNSPTGGVRSIRISGGYYYTRRNADTPPKNFMQLRYNVSTHEVYLAIAPPYKGDLFKE